MLTKILTHAPGLLIPSSPLTPRLLDVLTSCRSRDGALFARILNFLRDGRLLRPARLDDAAALDAELRYFELERHVQYTDFAGVAADMAVDVAADVAAGMAAGVAAGGEGQAPLAASESSPWVPLVEYVATPAAIPGVVATTPDVPGHFAAVQSRLLDRPNLRVVSTCAVPSSDGSCQLVTTLATQ